MRWQRRCRSVETNLGPRKAYRVPGTAEWKRNVRYRDRYFNALAGDVHAQGATEATHVR